MMITWTPVAEEQPPLKEYVLTYCAGKDYPCIETDRRCLKGDGLVYWDRDNDAASNIIPLSQAEHNRHHKTGTKHREATKEQISNGLSRAYADGRRRKPQITNRDNKGRITA